MRAFVLLLLVGGLLLCSCCKQGCDIPEQQKSLYKLQEKDFPSFFDDMNWNSLRIALLRQIQWLERKKGKDIANTHIFSNQRLLFTAKILYKKLEENPSREEFSRYIQNNFEIYQAAGQQQGGFKCHEMLVTGYYEPVFLGSLQKTTQFRYPIYRLPKRLKRNSQKEIVGIKNEKHHPFWSRAEIENNSLLIGEELAWLADPFDVYLLHIQGSGKIRLPDGSLHPVRFAGSNGHPYKSLGKLFVDKKIIPLEAITVPTMREWFITHPEDTIPMLQHNPRFIFFSWEENRKQSLPTNTQKNPTGSTGVELVDGRSIAVDFSQFPKGSIAFLMSRKPQYNENGQHISWQQFSRFVLPQDSGAAIKGTGRVDIFWGEDLYAERAASIMKERGTLYFLLAKEI